MLSRGSARVCRYSSRYSASAALFAGPGATAIPSRRGLVGRKTAVAAALKLPGLASGRLRRASLFAAHHMRPRTCDQLLLLPTAARNQAGCAASAGSSMLALRGTHGGALQSLFQWP